MALKIPGCSERIDGLWRKVEASNPALSQRQWAKDNGLDSTKFNNWTKDTQPDLDGLEHLARIFDVPWQWILLGDDGVEALMQFDKKAGRVREDALLPKAERVQVKALTGCVAGSRVLDGNADDDTQMRADLKSCSVDDGAWAFALIPDFGGTADFHWTKCMRQRGWVAGASRSGVHDYYRVAPDAPLCPERYTWNGNGCSEIQPVAVVPARGK